MPPRHTKSEFASFLFPAWMIGKYPGLKIMQFLIMQNYHQGSDLRFET